MRKFVVCQFLIGKIIGAILHPVTIGLLVSIPHRKDNSGTICPSDKTLYHIWILVNSGHLCTLIYLANLLSIFLNVPLKPISSPLNLQIN